MTSKNSASRRLGDKSPRPAAPQNQKEASRSPRPPPRSRIFPLARMTSIPAPVTSKNSASRRLGGKSPRPAAPQNQKRRPDYLGPLRALGFCLSPHDLATRPPSPLHTPR